MAEKTNNSQFKSSIEIPSGIKPINGQNFPILQGEYIEVTSRTDTVTPGNSAEESHATLEDRLQDLEDDKINREGNDSISGAFEVGSNLTVQENLIVKSNGSIKGRVDIQGKDIQDVGLEVTNNIVTHGKMLADSDISTLGNVQANGAGNFGGDVYGVNATFSGALSAGEDSTFNKNLEVKKNMVIQGNLTIIGQTISEDHTSLVVKDSMMFVGCELDENGNIKTVSDSGYTGLIMAMPAQEGQTEIEGYAICCNSTTKNLVYGKGIISGSGATSTSGKAELQFEFADKEIKQICLFDDTKCFVPTEAGSINPLAEDLLLTWNNSIKQMQPVELDLSKFNNEITFKTWGYNTSDEQKTDSTHVLFDKSYFDSTNKQINITTLFNFIYTVINEVAKSINYEYNFGLDEAVAWMLSELEESINDLRSELQEYADSKSEEAFEQAKGYTNDELAKQYNTITSETNRKTQSYFYCGAEITDATYTIQNLGLNKKTYVVAPVKSITLSNFENLVEGDYTTHDDGTYSSIDLSYTLMFTIGNTTVTEPFVFNLPESTEEISYTFKWGGMEPYNFFEEGRTYVVNFERIITNISNIEGEQTYLCSWEVF